MSKNHSHASTIDQFSGYYSIQMRGYSHTDTMNQGILTNGNQYLAQTVFTTSEYYLNEKNKYYENNEIDIKNIGSDPRTTLMIKNIPNKYTIQDLSS